MKRYRNLILTAGFIFLFLTACKFEAERNNPYDYKNISPPVVIGPDDGNYGSTEMPGVGMSDNGVAVAVWKQHLLDTGKYGVFVNRINLRESTSWKGSLQIGGSDNSECYMPQISVNGNGDAVVAWLEFNNSSITNSIWVKACAVNEWDSGSWVTLEDGAIRDTSDEIQNLRVSNNECKYSGLTVWYQGGSVNSVCAWVKFCDEEVPAGPDCITGSSQLIVPALTMIRASAMTSYWNAEWMLVVNNLLSDNIAAGWDIKNLYTGSTDEMTKPIDYDLDYAMSGKFITVYSRAGYNDLFAMTFSDPENIHSAMDILDPSVSDKAYRPRVVMNKYGNCANAVIVYQGAAGQIYASWLNLNSDMSINAADAAQLSTGTGSCGGQDAAMDYYGNFIAVWIQDGRLWAKRVRQWPPDESIEAIDAGGTVNFELSNPDVNRPRIAMDKDGNAFVVWVENNQIMARLLKI